MSKMIQGISVANAFSFASIALRNNVDAINSLNVFPVPDGDTGTNMFLTLQAATDHVNTQLKPLMGSDVADVLSGISRGALLGARGNSGVLLSQFLQGLASGYADSREELGRSTNVIDSKSWCKALLRGTEMAYSAVSVPVEGTMLTVLRAASDKAWQVYQSECDDILTILEQCVEAAASTLQLTPDMLDKLRDAGVVDAGGQGVVVILDALREYFSASFDDESVSIESLTIPEVQEISPLQWHIEFASEAGYGYCTEFIVTGEGIDIDQLRTEVELKGNSAIVVGNSSLVRIHIHTEDPGGILSIGAMVGRLSKVKVDDMDQQYIDSQMLGEAQSYRAVGVVAIAWGSGMVEVFEGMGAAVVKCGDFMNPSIQEIIDVIKGLGAENTVVLPNNPNVILTAKQVRSQLGNTVRVIETTTLPSGVAAILSYDSDSDIDSNVQIMSDSALNMRSGAVTQAIRDIVIDGVKSSRGDVIGLLDGKIVVAGQTEQLSLRAILEHAGVQQGDLVTLYRGAEVLLQKAEEVQRSLENDFMGVDIELVYGGQPRYSYFIGIE
jgi:hypothetical protein